VNSEVGRSIVAGIVRRAVSDRRGLPRGVVAEKTAGRTASQRGKPFTAGKSGNPAGRPKGALNKSTLLLAELLDGEGALIVRKAIDLAKDGNPLGLRLCFERLVPRRERVVEVDLPRVRKAVDVADAVAQVISEAAAGKMTLPEARDFLALLEQQRKALETSELAVRLELLESAVRDPNGE
jgi:hypothetical protein